MTRISVLAVVIVEVTVTVAVVVVVAASVIVVAVAVLTVLAGGVVMRGGRFCRGWNWNERARDSKECFRLRGTRKRAWTRA